MIEDYFTELYCAWRLFHRVEENILDYFKSVLSVCASSRIIKLCVRVNKDGVLYLHIHILTNDLEYVYTDLTTTFNYDWEVNDCGDAFSDVSLRLDDTVCSDFKIFNGGVI